VQIIFGSELYLKCMAAGSTRTLWGSCSAPRTHNGRFAEGGRKEGEGRRGFEDPSQKPGYWSGTDATDRDAVWVEDSGGPKEPCIIWTSTSSTGRGNNILVGNCNRPISCRNSGCRNSDRPPTLVVAENGAPFFVPSCI